MKRRHGLTILEAVVATALVGALLVGSLQMITAVASQRRAADQRLCAAQELSNVMERLASRRWSELTPEAAAVEKLSAEAAQRLPDAQLTAEITTFANDPKAKRISAALRWNAGGNRPPSEIKLSTVKYRIGQ